MSKSDDIKQWLMNSVLTDDQYSDNNTSHDDRQTSDYAVATLDRFFDGWRKEWEAKDIEDKLFADFALFVEEHNGVLNNQLSDVPYSVGIFEIGGKIITITHQEDVDECWREEYEKAQAEKGDTKK